MDERKLISLVERNPVVFNVLHEQFPNANQKKKTWNEIGEQLGTTGEYCKNTWTKIRNRYLRIRAHRKLTKKQPHEIMNRWQYEDEMEFYAKYLAKRNEMQTIQPYITMARNLYQVTSGSLRTQPANRNDSQKNSVDDDTADFVKGFDESSEDNEERMPSEDDDVLKTFFDAMLETVSGFSDRSQHKAKAKIFSIVSELEQRELDLKALMKA